MILLYNRIIGLVDTLLIIIHIFILLILQGSHSLRNIVLYISIECWQSFFLLINALTKFNILILLAHFYFVSAAIVQTWWQFFRTLWDFLEFFIFVIIQYWNSIRPKWKVIYKWILLLEFTLSLVMFIINNIYFFI
jgi:hypothetical protein